MSDDDGYPKALSWVQWFCSIDGHEFLAEVDPEFIRDQFNLYGLNAYFSKDKLKACLRMILSPQQPSEEDLADEAFLELN
jgi:casein kinase II subunit beta